MGATLRVKWELLMNWNLCNDHRSVFEETKKSFRAVYKDDIRMYESFCLNEKNTQSIIKV